MGGEISRQYKQEKLLNRRGNFPFKLEKMSEVGEGKFTICKGVIGVYT